MTRRPLPRALPALLTVLFALGFGSISGAVLCVSGSDHIAVELLRAERCHSELSAGTLVGSIDACPETCRDTPLTGGPVVREADAETPRLAAAMIVAFPGAASSSFQAEIGRWSIPALAEPAHRLSSTRTVVLLC
jgi:hypothetical protein